MTFEEELLEELREEIARGDVRVQSDEEFGARIEKRYPFVGSKIDWDQVPNSLERMVSTQDLESYYAEAERFVDEVSRSEALAQDQVIAVIGDYAMSFALTMSLRTFVRCLRRILSLPQHTYVTPLDGSWCMVFTMEGYLSFGYAPP